VRCPEIRPRTIHRSPEAVAIELVRIAVVIRKAMVHPVTIDPADRIDVHADGVVDQRHAFDEPLLVVQGAVLIQGSMPQANGGSGRRARFVKPYLLAALAAVPPAHDWAAQARAALEQWDGSAVGDAVTSMFLEPGEVIFASWIGRMREYFRDELGAAADEVTANVLTHVLDHALVGQSGVPPSRDYFNGVNPNVAMSLAFDQALALLGPPSVWSARPRATTRFRHILFPTVPEAGSMPQSNRGTYVQIVVLGSPVTAETILTPGQSGFIRLEGNKPVLDPHFSDQLSAYKNFTYKAMPLFRNWRLVP
jgi:hypothetical protein